jgi:hypothetical protein
MNIVSMKPKFVSGRTYNTVWSYSYIPVTKQWFWRVELHVKPQVFTGHAATEAEARERIQQITHPGKRKPDAGGNKPK